MNDCVREAIAKTHGYSMAYGLTQLILEAVSELDLPDDDPVIESAQKLVEALEAKRETMADDLDVVLKEHYGQK